MVGTISCSSHEHKYERPCGVGGGDTYVINTGELSPSYCRSGITFVRQKVKRRDQGMALLETFRIYSCSIWSLFLHLLVFGAWGSAAGCAAVIKRRLGYEETQGVLRNGLQKTGYSSTKVK